MSSESALAQVLTGRLPRTADLARRVAAHPEAPPMRARTSWRILAADARTPWRHQRWRCPRDPPFAAQAGRGRDRYAGWWEGQPLAPADGLVSAAAQTRLQARARCAATTPTRPGQPRRVEHGYARGGALGRGAATTGRAPVDRLVAQVLAPAPDRSAPRVFGVVDHGRRHRGDVAAARRRDRQPTRLLVQLPTHASWRNQLAIACASVQRQVLTPSDCPALAAVEPRLLAVATRDHDPAVPCHWRFTRADLDDRLAALAALPPPLPLPEPPQLAA